MHSACGGKEHEWPLYGLPDRNAIALAGFDARPEKEADLKTVDWDRAFFLTKYYMP